MSMRKGKPGKDSRQSDRYVGNTLMIEKVMAAASDAIDSNNAYQRKQASEGIQRDKRIAAQEKRMRRNAKRAQSCTG
jgi:hypothetical protein